MQFAICCIVGSAASTSSVAVVTYNNETTFLASAALTGPTKTLNFDSLPALQLVPSGTTLSGITFNYTISNGVGGFLSAQVRDDYYTTSDDNYLTLDYSGSADQFISSETLTLSFAPTHSIGLYVITSSSLAANAVTVTTSSGTAESSATADMNPGGVTNAYFTGLIDPVNLFSTATVTTESSSPFFFYVDDISVATPEPGLAGGVMMLLCPLVMRRRAKAAIATKDFSIQCRG
jgi:hypothetical protein